MEYMLWIWVAITAVSAIVEFVTVELVSIWFTCGGIIAMISYAAKAPYWAQIIVFVLSSIVLMVVFRKLTIRHLLKSVQGKTNLDNIIGMCVYADEGADGDGDGTLHIRDVVWQFRSVDNSPISAGNKVEIVDIKGNKLIVKKIDDDDNQN